MLTKDIIDAIIYVGASRTSISDRGSIVEVFTDLSVWLGIKSVIQGNYAERDPKLRILYGGC